MTTRIWNGSTGSFSNAASWSPNGVPTSGDTAIINAGNVSAAGLISGVAIQLNEGSGATASTTLALNGTTLDASSTLTVTNSNVFNSTAPTVSTSGRSVLAGTSSFNGTQILLPISAGSTLVNSGTMNFFASSPQLTGGGTFENDGTFALVNPSSLTQIPQINDAVTGTGVIALGPNARLAIGASVASSQTVIFNGGNSGNETFELDQVSTFNATINGFSASDLIAVINTPYSSATYTSTGNNSGTLRLFSGGTLEGSLNFTGQYSLGSFSFKFNDFGSGLSNLQISTTVMNNQSAGLPAGYQTGGTITNPPTVGAVYRFFDKNTGTHFFTADSGERDNTKTLSNYVQETNDFGDVTQSDPNSEAVYRFFDTKFGTHFFTASASEKDTVIATRPDLTYEPTSTFYEHSTQQSGDVAVYRFFDTQFGTHFYTGDATEAATTATLKIAGTNQASYTAEGIGFYAPAGSFT